jgi:hypothetical protein
MASDSYATHRSSDGSGSRLPATGAFARPHSSRVWNYAGGGKNNFRADREVCYDLAGAVTLSSAFPEMVEDNQAFLERAVRHLAALGIRQFIDLGPGIPVAAPNVYAGVLATDGRAKVVYIDNDPVVLMHTWQLIDDPHQSLIVEGNIFDPEQLFKDNEILDFLDWSKPIALVCTAVLHEHPGPIDELTAIMQTYVDHLPPDSYTVVSHLLDPENHHTKTVRKLEEVMIAHCADSWFRTRADIEALFAGQQLLADVQPCRHWDLLEESDAAEPDLGFIAGGVGRVHRIGKLT